MAGTIEIGVLLGLLGALQGFVLAGAVALIGGSGARLNRALALLICSLATAVASIVLEHSGWLTNPIYAILVEYTMGLFFPVILWQYSSLVLGRRVGPRIWLHAIPGIAWIVYVLSYALGSTTYRFLPPMEFMVGYMALYTLMVAVRVVRGARKGTTLLHHLDVLKLGAVLVVAVHLAQLVRLVLPHVRALRDIVPIVAATSIFLLSGLAFRQSRLFAGSDRQPTAPRYVESLDSKPAEETLVRLQRCLEIDKPFLNENLTVADLARRLKVPRAHLSQVINTRLNTNFSELMNERRVAEANKLLGDPSTLHMTVEGIGYEVGFRSRSAFHNAFRRLTGETPAQARNRVLG